MWYITQTSPTWPAVFRYLKPRVRPLYIETCCLPRIDSHETKENPVWPRHDVTGMCASEFKTHPLSSWHLFTIIIAQPQLCLCDPYKPELPRLSCVSSRAWTRRSSPVSCESMDSAGKCGLPHRIFGELWTEILCILFSWSFLYPDLGSRKGIDFCHLKLSVTVLCCFALELDWNVQIQMTVKPARTDWFIILIWKLRLVVLTLIFDLKKTLKIKFKWSNDGHELTSATVSSYFF